jgi:hypothetical protein
LNCEPELGVQLVLTGAFPPPTVGFANFTTAFPLLPLAVTGAMVGHVIASGGSDGCGAGCDAGSGGGSTTTVDEHEARCDAESVAVHVKEVVPTGNNEPDAGEQVVITGVTPPLTVGVIVTAIDLPSSDVSTGDGHEIVSAGSAVVTV